MAPLVAFSPSHYRAVKDLIRGPLGLRGGGRGLNSQKPPLLQQRLRHPSQEAPPLPFDVIAPLWFCFAFFLTKKVFCACVCQPLKFLFLFAYFNPFAFFLNRVVLALLVDLQG